MAPHFEVLKFKDCDLITDPSEKDRIFMVLRGSAIVIADDRTHKSAHRAIRKTRHKRKKAAEKLAAEIEAGLADPEQANANGKDKAKKPS